MKRLLCSHHMKYLNFMRHGAQMILTNYIRRPKEKQVSVASLLPKFDTTAGYVAQYSAVGDYASIMPTAEDIEKHRNLSDDKLAFPPWYKNEAGRPGASGPSEEPAETQNRLTSPQNAA